jgi:hypothetical protein
MRQLNATAKEEIRTDKDGIRPRSMPVKFPPGRARLAMRPTLTGSSPTIKTMGIVEVADLAANAGLVAPTAAITAAN